ncbi:unnamed protein product [Enterobius vermicularis]|uniref:Ig-like domain-containing protein n=1 Tax=Enterobius vermicularis TaxID=51028 RepID=A0A0N4V961_ENTVE|nr:unnamed protein product [Enterobius vermicularis]
MSVISFVSEQLKLSQQRRICFWRNLQRYAKKAQVKCWVAEKNDHEMTEEETGEVVEKCYIFKKQGARKASPSSFAVAEYLYRSESACTYVYERNNADRQVNAVQGELEGQGGDNITVGLHRRLHGLGLYSQVMSRELSSYLRTFHVGCSSTRAIFNGQKTSGDTWFLPANEMKVQKFSHGSASNRSVFMTNRYGTNIYPAIIIECSRMGLFGWTLQFGIREFQRGGTGVICRIGVGEWVLVTHNTSCDTFAVNCFIKPLLRTQWNSVYGSFEVFTQAVKLDALTAESVDFGLVAYDRNGILLDYNEVYDVKVRILNSPEEHQHKRVVWVISEIVSVTDTSQFSSGGRHYPQNNLSCGREIDYSIQFSSIIREVLPPVKRNEGAEVLFKGNTLQCSNCRGVVRQVSRTSIEVWCSVFSYGAKLSFLRSRFEVITEATPSVGTWIRFDACGYPDKLELLRAEILPAPVRQRCTDYFLKVETVVLHCGIRAGNLGSSFLGYSHLFGFVLDVFNRLTVVDSPVFLKCWVFPLDGHPDISWGIAEGSVIHKVKNYKGDEVCELSDVRDPFDVAGRLKPLDLQVEDKCVNNINCVSSFQATEAETIRYCIVQIMKKKDLRKDIERQDPALYRILRGYMRKWKNTDEKSSGYRFQCIDDLTIGQVMLLFQKHAQHFRFVALGRNAEEPYVIRRPDSADSLEVTRQEMKKKGDNVVFDRGLGVTFVFACDLLPTV